MWWWEAGEMVMELVLVGLVPWECGTYQEVGSKLILEGRALLNQNQWKAGRGDKRSTSVSLLVLFPRFLFVASGGDIAMVWTHTPGLELGRAGDKERLKDQRICTGVKVDSSCYILVISLDNLCLISSMTVLIAYAFARLCQLQLKFSVLFHGVGLVL